MRPVFAAQVRRESIDLDERKSKGCMYMISREQKRTRETEIAVVLMTTRFIDSAGDSISTPMFLKFLLSYI